MTVTGSRHHMSRVARVGFRPVGHRAPEIRQIVSGDIHRAGLVVGEDVHHSITHLDIDRADFLGRCRPRPPPSIIAGPPIPMLASGWRSARRRHRPERRCRRSSGPRPQRRWAPRPAARRVREGVELQSECPVSIPVSPGAPAALREQNQRNTFAPHHPAICRSYRDCAYPAYRRGPSSRTT